MPEPILRFPNELTDHIMSQLVTKDPIDKIALLECGLVSQAWLRTSRRLFGAIHGVCITIPETPNPHDIVELLEHPHSTFTRPGYIPRFSLDLSCLCEDVNLDKSKRALRALNDADIDTLQIWLLSQPAEHHIYARLLRESRILRGVNLLEVKVGFMNTLHMDWIMHIVAGSLSLANLNICGNPGSRLEATCTTPLPHSSDERAPAFRALTISIHDALRFLLPWVTHGLTSLAVGLGSTLDCDALDTFLQLAASNSLEELRFDYICQPRERSRICLGESTRNFLLSRKLFSWLFREDQPQQPNSPYVPPYQKSSYSA